MERVSIFIDSGNFYHIALKKLNKREGDFDFEKFANFLANGREIIKDGKRFYVGTVPALDWVRERTGKKVEYIGFSIPKNNNHEETKPTNKMIANSDIQRVLIESDIKQFFKEILDQSQ